MASFNSTLKNITIFACNHLEFCVRYNEAAFYIETAVIVLSVIDFILIAATIIINGMFILSMYLYEILRTSSNLLLLNLAVVDILFGTVGLFVCSLFQLQFIGCQKRLCFYKDLYIHFFGTGKALTMMTFTLISIERYICIFYALRWAQILTKKRVAGTIAVMWLLVGSMSTFPRVFERWDIFDIMYLVQFLINILIILVTNIKIFKEIRRHEKRIAQEQVAPNSVETRKTREKKRAKTISLMILLMITCYLPALLIIAAGKIPSVDPIQLQFGWMACRTISLSHSTFDFLVYGLKTEEIRAAFKKILNQFRCRQSNEDIA